jgi:hypothetical protein
VGAILFTCPSTRFTVQYWLDDDERASEDDYEEVTCPACPRALCQSRGQGLGRRCRLGRPLPLTRAFPAARMSGRIGKAWSRDSRPW